MSESQSATPGKSSSPARSDPAKAVVHHFGLQDETANVQAVRALLKMTGRKLGLAEEMALAVVGAYLVRAGLGETSRLVLISELATHDPRQLAVDVVAVFDGVYATVTLPTALRAGICDQGMRSTIPSSAAATASS